MGHGPPIDTFASDSVHACRPNPMHFRLWRPWAFFERIVAPEDGWPRPLWNLREGLREPPVTHSERGSARKRKAVARMETSRFPWHSCRSKRRPTVGRRIIFPQLFLFGGSLPIGPELAGFRSMSTRMGSASPLGHRVSQAGESRILSFGGALGPPTGWLRLGAFAGTHMEGAFV